MGANGSREVSINESENKDSIPRSSTLPAGLKGLGGKLNFPGTLPRGLGLDTSFSVKLTKSKKLDGSPSKKEHDQTEVEIIIKETEDKEQEDGKVVEETDDVEEETMKDFIEALLIKVIEDTIEKALKNKMKRSSTLPSTFRGLGRLGRSNSFGKRVRQSFRKLVAVKKPIEENIEDALVEKKSEEDVEDNVELNEETEKMDTADTMNTTGKSLQIPFKKIDFEAKKKRFQATLKKMVHKNRKPKKESIELIHSIIDEIIKDVQGVEEEEAKETDDKDLEDMWTKRDDEMFAPTLAEESVGVLDKSND